MLSAAITLICLGLAGLAFGFSPDLWAELGASLLPDAPRLPPGIPAQPVMAVAGAIYLSGIVLLAGALLRRTAVGYLQALVRQRADLEALQNAVLLAVERLETEHRETSRRKQLVSTEIQTLAEEFERANAAVRADD